MAGTECHMDCLQLQKNLIGELKWYLKGYQGRRLSKEIIAKLKPHFARCGLPDRVNADILGPSLTVLNFRTLQNSCTLNTSKRPTISTVQCGSALTEIVDILRPCIIVNGVSHYALQGRFQWRLGPESSVSVTMCCKTKKQCRHICMM